MNLTSLKILPIIDSGMHSDGQNHAFCWIKKKVDTFTINDLTYKDVGRSVFFLHPDISWSIDRKSGATSAGYVLYLPTEIFDEPMLNRLHINEVRLFNRNEILKVNLAPGIELRTQAILEMIDELLGSNLNHRENAILSLLNTLFVYFDGRCNIRSVVSENNSQKNIVYNFKRMLAKKYKTCHEVREYAQLLNISEKYLNECTREVLNETAKYLIIEQLLMRSRYALKFTDRSIKEVAFQLGFSSPDYFSSFIKKHTGLSPSVLRRG